MKAPSKILTRKLLMVIIFWSTSLSTVSWSSPKARPQDIPNQDINQNSSGGKSAYPKNDSLAQILCDKKPPYFTDLKPDNGQKKIDHYSIIEFTANDDNVTVGNWDTSGVDTSKIFISIKSRFLNVYSVKPDSIKLLNNKPFKVECTYHPRQVFDWTDTVTVKLDAWDLSYFRNHADTTYTFYTIRDTIAPVLTPIFPLPGDQNVPLSSIVIIQGTEIGRGVVLDSIKLWINDSLVARTIKGDPWNFQIFYDSNSSWYFDQDIHVVCTAYDLDRNAVALDYWINTESPPDTSGPWFIDLIPASGDTAVPRETSINFTVVDDYLGVDVDSVFIFIISRLQSMQKVPVGSFQINDPCSVRFVYQPPKAFDWNDTVRIELLAHDLSQPAKPGDTTFIFYTVKDTTSDNKPPVVTVIRPRPNTTNVPISTDIVLYVTDDLSGVDTSAVELSVDNQIIPHSRIQFFNDGSGDTVKYQPLTPFDYNNRVNIYFKVEDFYKNGADTSYYFDTKIDTTQPLIEVYRPLLSDTSVSVITDIVLYVIDDLSGVDTSKVELVVNHQVIHHSLIDFINDGIGDTVKYQPLTSFPSDYQVDVYFKVVDFANNWADTAYWFKTETIPPPDKIRPVIEVIRPLPNETGVDTTTDIVLYVTDDFSGVDTASVVFKVNDQVINLSDTNFVYDSVGDTVRYNPSSPFDHQSEVKIYFYVADSAGNSADTSYSFWTEDSITRDIIPPKIEVIRPLPNSIDVSIYTDVVLYVTDDSSGVDTASVVFKVNNQIIPHSNIDFIVNESGDTIKYIPSLPFAYQSEVKVYFYVADSAPNPADISYSFWTEPEPDTTAPWFVDLDPDSAKPNVPRDSKIKFTVMDDKSGVDTNSVTVKLERGTYSEEGKPSILQFLENGRKVLCEYEPNEKFEFGDIVGVTLSAQDTIKKEGLKEYWFAVADTDTTTMDRDGPIVFDHDPDIYGSIDILDYSIQFKVRDESGVNYLSIVTKIRINGGETKFLDSIRRVSVTGDTVKVESEPLHFNFNDTVYVDIYAEDNAGNHTDTTGKDSTVHYYFTVPQDSEPPRIVLIDPIKLASDQDSFLVRIEDNISGVDIAKCEMYLWSQKSPEQKKIDMPSFVKINNKKKVDIEYYPDNPYEYNDILSLKFFLQDNCGNSTTVTLPDTIYTASILADLFVLNFISSAGEKPVKVNTNVSLEAYIICANADCPDSFSVYFYLNDSEQPFQTIQIPGLDKDEVIPKNTSFVIPIEGVHKITVCVDCFDNIREAIESNNCAEVTVIAKGAELIAPNIFTPNEDGFNDEAEFNFEQFDVEYPNLKIFDMHGKKEKEFVAEDANKKRFKWRGSDSNGRPLLPGVYLYIFSDKDKAIAKGALVIAR